MPVEESSEDVVEPPFSASVFGKDDRRDYRNIRCASGGLHKQTLVDFDFEGATFMDASFNSCSFHRVSFRKVNFDRFGFNGCRFHNCIFEGAFFSETNMSGAYLSNHDFNGAVFHSVKFDKAILHNCDLSAAQTDPFTTFEGAAVGGCHVNRFFLDMLEGHGKLTVGQRMTMDIRDDAATLKQSYSGFWSAVHVLALLAFVLPYGSFLATEYISSMSTTCGGAESCTTIWANLKSFVWSGGTGSGFNVTFLLFMFSLVYNALRGVLLWKTKSLELAGRATGLPIQFSLSQKIVGTVTWSHLLQFAGWGFLLNVALALLHSYLFLQLRVPL